MSECQPCCVFDVATVPDLAAGGYAVYPTQDYSFVITTCPLGVICPPGLLPQTVTVKKGGIPPVTIPPNPRLLTLQGCQSLITATVPPGSSASVIAGIAAGMQQQFAQQQANCNLTTQFQLPKQPPTTLLPTIPLNGGCPNVALSQSLPGLTGINPLMPVVVSGGSLPPGLTLTQPTATTAPILSGTPTAAGNFAFTLQGTSPTGVVIQQPYTLNILGIGNLASLPSAMENTPYSFQLVGAGGTGPYTFVLTAGTLPGITLSPSGLFSGTPNYVTAGSYLFTVKVTDFTGLSCSQNGTLIVTLRPGPDWTQFVWSSYTLNQSPPDSSCVGVALKNVASGALSTDAVGAPGTNPTIKPVAAAGVTYTGPSVTARMILTISNGAPFATLCQRLLSSAGLNFGPFCGAAPASGVYTADVTIPLSVGVTFTLDAGGGNWAAIAGGGGAGALSFTWAIVNV